MKSQFSLTFKDLHASPQNFWIIVQFFWFPGSMQFSHIVCCRLPLPRIENPRKPSQVSSLSITCSHGQYRQAFRTEPHWPTFGLRGNQHGSKEELFLYPAWRCGPYMAMQPYQLKYWDASQMVLVVKNHLQCRRRKKYRFKPWVGKIPWVGGHGNPLQYPCLGNPMDGGAWWATVHRSQRVRHN